MRSPIYSYSSVYEDILFECFYYQIIENIASALIIRKLYLDVSL